MSQSRTGWPCETEPPIAGMDDTQPYLLAKEQALKIRFAICATAGFLATAQPSFSEIFLCTDGGFLGNVPTVEREPYPAGKLLSCQCDEQLLHNQRNRTHDLAEMWQCMGRAVTACNKVSDREMCYGEVLSFLEKRTLLRVKPATFIEFATRINFAILTDIERQEAELRDANSDVQGD